MTIPIINRDKTKNMFVGSAWILSSIIVSSMPGNIDYGHTQSAPQRNIFACDEAFPKRPPRKDFFFSPVKLGSYQSSSY